MARLARADRKAKVIQITTLYLSGEQKSISEWIPCWTLATAAADQIRFHSCQLRTGNLGGAVVTGSTEVNVVSA